MRCMAPQTVAQSHAGTQVYRRKLPHGERQYAKSGEEAARK